MSPINKRMAISLLCAFSLADSFSYIIWCCLVCRLDIFLDTLFSGGVEDSIARIFELYNWALSCVISKVVQNLINFFQIHLQVGIKL